MRTILPNSQTRALAIAMTGAAVAAVTTMLLPVTLLEGFTGSTGLSELVPAARAPLGDTARALIAFATGAITLATLCFLLLRAEGPVAGPTKKDASIFGAIAEQGADMAKSLFARMPWNKGADDIRELGDLPKLRTGDVHPDAPARRPLFASQDLPTLELSEEHLVASPEAQEIAQEAELVEEPLADVAPAPAPEPVAIGIEGPSVLAGSQPSIAEMVAQLEASVALRRQKLAELEAVAADLSINANIDEEPEHITSDAANVPVAEPDEAVAEIRPVRRPPLEAVPTVAVQDDDIDSALAAALATLHRINAGAR